MYREIVSAEAWEEIKVQPRKFVLDASRDDSQCNILMDFRERRSNYFVQNTIAITKHFSRNIESEEPQHFV